MADRPILFSTPMILALLAGRKTQTRRLVKIGGAGGPILDFVKVGTDKETGRSVYEMKGRGGVSISIAAGKHLATPHYMPPIAVGDRLWVKESAKRMPALWHYSADETEIGWPGRQPLAHFKRDNCLSIHLPKVASRLTLIVEDVKIERLQDISEEDALAEGVPTDDDYAGSFAKEYCRNCGGSGVHGALGAGYGVIEVDCAECATAKLRYQNLWDHINGAGSWEANPWVVAYTFRVIPQNIDQIARAA
jgi:hypothetical protein